MIPLDLPFYMSQATPALMVFHLVFPFLFPLYPFLWALGVEIHVSKRQTCGFRHGCRRMPTQQLWAAHKHLATRGKKSLSFLIEINVSTSRDRYRTTASSHRLGFSPEKSSFPFLWTQKLHPQARFHKSGPRTPTQNQSLFLGLRCYTSTHKNIQKLVSLSQKEKVKKSYPAQRSGNTFPPGSHIWCIPWAAEPPGWGSWQVGIWVMRCWDLPSSPSHAGRSHWRSADTFNLLLSSSLKADNPATVSALVSPG